MHRFPNSFLVKHRYVKLHASTRLVQPRISHRRRPAAPQPQALFATSIASGLISTPTILSLAAVCTFAYTFSQAQYIARSPISIVLVSAAALVTSALLKHSSLSTLVWTSLLLAALTLLRVSYYYWLFARKAKKMESKQPPKKRKNRSPRPPPEPVGLPTPLDRSAQAYEAQLATKVNRVYREAFTKVFGVLPPLELYRSPPDHYRMRTEFRYWHERENHDSFYVMHEKIGGGEEAAEDGGEGGGGGGGGGEEAAAQQQEEENEEEEEEDEEADETTINAARSILAPTPHLTKKQRRAAKRKRDTGRAPPTTRLVRIDSFPAASPLINALMPRIRSAVQASQTLKDRLFQVNFHSTLSGEVMISLLYHKTLDEQWKKEAEALRHALAGRSIDANGDASIQRVVEAVGIEALPGLAPNHIPIMLGRARKQRVELDKNFVWETLTVDGPDSISALVHHDTAKDASTKPLPTPHPPPPSSPPLEPQSFQYMQIEETFSQPNGIMCQHMLTWARDVARRSLPCIATATETQGIASTPAERGDLLELYCGNGNFTIALAALFDRVVATEIAKDSVEAARLNAEKNAVTNMFVAATSSESFVEKWKENKVIKGLEAIDWATLQLRTLLVDPPRAGLDPETLALCRRFDSIIYVSCNPATLLDNCVALRDEYEIQRFALFDQFPFTHHVECGVLLRRRMGVAPVEYMK